MDNYGIKNSLRVTIGKNDENKRFILNLKKVINV
jgi:histidinol-phosphate/aromatic aminotransferase/cobyric acid decarboxylase-like protein